MLIVDIEALHATDTCMHIHIHSYLFIYFQKTSHASSITFLNTQQLKTSYLDILIIRFKFEVKRNYYQRYKKEHF